MSARITVKKTCKLFIGGSFPRTESGRYDPWPEPGPTQYNVCRASRKDARNAVVAARSALSGWSKASAYLKDQILYRTAEILESRHDSLVQLLTEAGLTRQQATAEVDQAIDLWVHYAGWSDKFQALSSTVNPVASSHFVFSTPRPTGVLGLFCEPDSGLAGLSARLAPLIVGGNTVVAVTSPKYPTLMVAMAEALQASDLPGGVVNLLSGRRDELLDPLSRHQDVNGILIAGGNKSENHSCQENASLSVKRLKLKKPGQDWLSPYAILDFQEIQTTWHPVAL